MAAPPWVPPRGLAAPTVALLLALAPPVAGRFTFGGLDERASIGVAAGAGAAVLVVVVATVVCCVVRRRRARLAAEATGLLSPEGKSIAASSARSGAAARSRAQGQGVCDSPSKDSLYGGTNATGTAMHSAEFYSPPPSAVAAAAGGGKKAERAAATRFPPLPPRSPRVVATPRSANVSGPFPPPKAASADADSLSVSRGPSPVPAAPGDGVPLAMLTPPDAAAPVGH